MAGGRYPRTVAGRFTEVEGTRFDAVCRLKGIVLAQYVRQTMLRAVEEDLRAEVNGFEPDTAESRA